MGGPGSGRKPSGTGNWKRTLTHRRRVGAGKKTGLKLSAYAKRNRKELAYMKKHPGYIPFTGMGR